jgi:hypothetical protein
MIILYTFTFLCWTFIYVKTRCVHIKLYYSKIVKLLQKAKIDYVFEL